jgi:hypothetical protein
MFWIVTLTIPILFIVKKGVDYIYPGKLKGAVISTYWNTLQLCSVIETHTSRLYNTITMYVPFLRRDTNTHIRFICDGDEVQTYTLGEFIKADHSYTNYNFILYELPIKDHNKYDTYIFRYANYKNILPIEYNSPNDINFLSIQLEHFGSGLSYNINFGRNFFLINNNILFDFQFLKWYLYKYHTTIIDVNDKYKLSFIDHNMKYVCITENEYIIIRKNNYDIINK